MSEHTRQKPDMLLQIVDENDMEAALQLVRDIGRYTNVVYHLGFRANLSTEIPFIKNTYPGDWLARYVQMDYFSIDPVVEQGFSRTEPFFWSELETNEEQDAFFKDAEEHGAGSVGFSIPLNDRSQRRAVFSVTGSMLDSSWRRKIKAERPVLERIGDVLHRKAIRQVYGTEEGPTLAPREIECLYWTARGKDIGAVAGIISISEHTVRGYLKSARLKLGASTIAQAIHEATKLRLISF